MKNLFYIFILALFFESNGFCSDRTFGGAYSVYYGLMRFETESYHGAGLKLSGIYNEVLEFDLLIGGYGGDSDRFANIAAGLNYLIVSQLFASFKIQVLVSADAGTYYEPSIIYGNKLRLELGAMFNKAYNDEIYPTAKVSLRFLSFRNPFSSSDYKPYERFSPFSDD